MSLDGYYQAGRDLDLYVESLNLPEVIGELVHLGRSVDRIMARAGDDPAGTDQLRASMSILTLAYAMSSLAGQLGAKHAFILPAHDPDGNGMHACTFIARMVEHADDAG